MDRAFIENNQIVERYLTGKLPYKGAQDFERHCRENPQVLEELKLGEHLAAGMRLLEASGKPPGWQADAISWWRRWEFTAGLGVICLALGITAWILAGKSAERAQRIATLEKQLAAGPLTAPGSVRSIKLEPGRQPGSGPMVYLGQARRAELIELSIDVSYAKSNAFRMVVEAKDRTRVGTLHSVLRDSNGEVRLAVNTSAVQPGQYKVLLESLPFRGRPTPVGWFGVQVD